ncbi:NitT/TauT family transport system permease protein OS=Castellaniella defragrans OX=75697 GN=HNR28_000285 PE=3 SV=1 [Castellaniella defragrans]
MVLILWELLARILRSSGLPPVTQVIPRAADLVKSGEAFGPLGATFFRTVVGFLLGFSLGVAYGITTFLFETFERFTRCLFQIALFTPTLILIFVSLVALGRNNLTVILVNGFVVTATVGVYMRDAIRDFDGELADMADSYKATLLQRFTGMYLPFLVPAALAAGRIGFALAWKVAFLTEVFGFPGGLGWQVRNSYTIYDMTSLMAWLILFVATLLISQQLIRWMERRFVRWQ